MRYPLTSLLFVFALLSVWYGSSAPASDVPAVPTPASIEQLVRERLAGDAYRTPLPRSYAKANRMDITLVSLESLSPSRWHAEIEILLDYGPPPPSVLSFEQLRRADYRLVLDRRGEKSDLSRFTPIASMHPLPGGA